MVCEIAVSLASKGVVRSVEVAGLELSCWVGVVTGGGSTVASGGTV